MGRLGEKEILIKMKMKQLLKTRIILPQAIGAFMIVFSLLADLGLKIDSEMHGWKINIYTFLLTDIITWVTAIGLIIKRKWGCILSLFIYLYILWGIVSEYFEKYNYSDSHEMYFRAYIPIILFCTIIIAVTYKYYWDSYK